MTESTVTLSLWGWTLWASDISHTHTQTQTLKHSFLWCRALKKQTSVKQALSVQLVKHSAIITSSTLLSFKVQISILAQWWRQKNRVPTLWLWLLLSTDGPNDCVNTHCGTARTAADPSETQNQIYRNGQSTVNSYSEVWHRRCRDQTSSKIVHTRLQNQKHGTNRLLSLAFSFNACFKKRGGVIHQKLPHLLGSI